MIKDGLMKPGEAPEHWGFTKENFDEGSYLWMTKGVCTVSFVAAKVMGTGAFSRLVKAIEADGIKIEVPTPLPLMRAIIRRWGFKPSRQWSDDFQDHVEVWTR